MQHDSTNRHEQGPTLRPRRASGNRALAIAAAALSWPVTGLPQVATYDHVVVVVMENHSFSEIIGNTAKAPYINSLAAGGASFTQSFAVEHPSEPNYLDLFSGSNQGVTADSCPHTFSTDNLGSQLIAANLTFIGFSEDLPASDPQICTYGTHGYARKHNPWVNFSNVPATSNQPFTAFPADFSGLPTVSFVVPNLCSDMHDCTIAVGDAWLSQHIDTYTRWARSHNSLLILTWDEDDHSASNQVPTIFAGALVIPGIYAESINHFDVLATLEAMYGLDAIGAAASNPAITDLFDTTLFRNGFE
ncbi:MAG TPA: alkaline phosphatase family protein [Xanthobacteraceae bacterium]|nr:alkaline phosphatase family protein [Xanthobacteraceae bacterium]